MAPEQIVNSPSIKSLGSAADLVFQQLQQLEQFKASKNISIYISMPSCEIMTTNIIHHLLKSGNYFTAKTINIQLSISFSIPQIKIVIYLVAQEPQWTW